MAAVRVRSLAAGSHHSLALGWDGRVHSWGQNLLGSLGHGDQVSRPTPTLVEALDDVRSIAAAAGHSLAVTQLGGVCHWGESVHRGVEDALLPSTVEGFDGVRMRRVCAGAEVAFAIGENRQLF
jgi:alpha-tubulin suppressor-like RCC1 family protein